MTIVQEIKFCIEKCLGGTEIYHLPIWRYWYAGKACAE